MLLLGQARRRRDRMLLPRKRIRLGDRMNRSARPPLSRSRPTRCRNATGRSSSVWSPVRYRSACAAPPGRADALKPTPKQRPLGAVAGRDGQLESSRRQLWPAPRCSRRAATPSTPPWPWRRSPGWSCPANVESAVTHSRWCVSPTGGCGRSGVRLRSRWRGEIVLPRSGHVHHPAIWSTGCRRSPARLRRWPDLHAHGASLGLPELREPAARLAETGLACSAKTAADVAEALTAIRRDPGLAGVYAPGRECGADGDRLAQPDLARTIRRLAQRPGRLLHRRIRRACRLDARRGRCAVQRRRVGGRGRRRTRGGDHRPLRGAPPSTKLRCPRPAGWCCSRLRCATVSSDPSPGWAPARSTGWRAGRPTGLPGPTGAVRQRQCWMA